MAFDVQILVANVLALEIARRPSSAALVAHVSSLGRPDFVARPLDVTEHGNLPIGRYHFASATCDPRHRGGAGHGPGEALRAIAATAANHELRRLQLANVGSVLGSWAYVVAMLVYAYDVGGATAVALVTIAQDDPRRAWRVLSRPCSATAWGAAA